MAEMNTIAVEGQAISYRKNGCGPPVILLHCSTSHSGQWGALIDILSPNFTALAPDLHGYGRSDPLPRDGRAYFQRDCAIIDRLAARYGGRVHLVGHSLGGTIALRYGVKHHDHVASLTLIEPVQFSLLEQTDAPEQAEFHQIATAINTLVRLKQNRKAARHFVDFWASGGAFAAMDSRTQANIEKTIARVTDDWAGASMHAPEQLQIADLATLSVPCQIIRGAASRASTRAIAGILHKHIDASILHEIPGADHMGVASQPGAYNEIILAFLQSVTHEITRNHTENEEKSDV